MSEEDDFDASPALWQFIVLSLGLGLEGMYFDDPQTWKEIIEPKLKQFSVYKPA